MTTTTELLPNYLGGQWHSGTGKGVALLDPATCAELLRVDASGLELAAGFSFVRAAGGAARSGCRVNRNN